MGRDIYFLDIQVVSRRRCANFKVVIVRIQTNNFFKSKNACSEMRRQGIGTFGNCPWKC